MATFTKVLLSGCTDGLGVLIAATTAGGTTVHTAINSTTTIDEVWLYAANENTSDATLNIEWGGTTDVTNTMKMVIPYKSGLQLVTPGLPINNAKIIKAYASITNKISIYGFVNRIEP